MPSIRDTFLADDGCIFVRGDLSQVEDRMGKMYCRTPRMVELANKKPWEYDTHTENARLIFEKNEINKEERQLGKKVVHAAWRGMRGDKMAENVAKETKGKLILPAKECQRLIDKFHKKNHEISEIYFPWVRQQMQTGILRNSWGRILNLRSWHIDADLEREAFSFYPQSECADWMNQYGLIPIFKYLWAKYNKAPNLQIHDDITCSVPLKDAYDTAVFMLKSVEQRREIPAGSEQFLCVPMDIKIALNLSGGVEFKKFPDSKEEFYATVEAGLFK